MTSVERENNNYKFPEFVNGTDYKVHVKIIRLHMFHSVNSKIQIVLTKIVAVQILILFINRNIKYASKSANKFSNITSKNLGSAI